MSEYFDNGIPFPRYSSDVRKLIGKKIKYVRTVDVEKSRGTYFPQTGTVKDVSYKNVLIDSDWEWIPRIIEYEVIPHPLASQ
jgi:hypothetical protein